MGKTGIDKVEEKERGENTLHATLTTGQKAHGRVHKAAKKELFWEEISGFIKSPKEKKWKT